MAKKKPNWTDWLPDRPFNPSETIREWDVENINFDDETVCALCGKTSDCVCYKHRCNKCGGYTVSCSCCNDVCSSCNKIKYLCVCEEE